MRRAAPILAAGVLGLLIGFALACLLQKRRVENQLMGVDAAAATISNSEGASVLAPAPEAGREPLQRSAPAPSESMPAAPLGPTTDPSTALVFGTLLDTEGKPLRGRWYANVSFVDHLGKRRFVDAKEGAYAMSGLAWGTYSLSASAEGFRSHEESVDLSSTQPIVRKDLALEKMVILKIKAVTPEGKPLFKALSESSLPSLGRAIVPVATKDSPGNRIFEVVGSHNNPFGVGQLWDYGPPIAGLTPEYIGVIMLNCDLPVHVSLVLCHVVLQTQRVDPGTDVVVFVCSPDQILANLTTISARVVDADTQQAVEGAYVSLTGGPSGGGEGRTDAAGLVEIKNGAPGRFALTIAKGGYEGIHKTLDVEPGKLTDLGKVALEKEITVQGRVLDGDGNPISASFNIGAWEPGGDTIQRLFDVVSSDGTGALTIPALGRRQYVLRTNNHDAAFDGDKPVDAWVSGNVIIDARAGPIKDLTIRLKPAPMLVLHVKEGLKEGMRFRVVDEQGIALIEDRFWIDSAPRPLRMPPGAYRVTLLDPKGSVLAEREVSLGAGTVELDLHP